MKGGLNVLLGLVFILASLVLLILYDFWQPFWEYIIKGGLTFFCLVGGAALLLLVGMEWWEDRRQSQSGSS
jgi:hypothetical protein